MSNVSKRSRSALNLKRYCKLNKPDHLGYLELNPPEKRQYILRMLIATPSDGLKLPNDLMWTMPLINMSMEYQKNKIKVIHPFTYLTIRHGLVTSEKDDEWHVDGFSMRITHLPEQNYIWSNKFPTKILNSKIKIPKKFDPFKHNIHSLFKKFVKEKNVYSCLKNEVYCIDPYVIHKRPKIKNETYRTFVRVSYVPIEINDVNNTQNPYLLRTYSQDGVKDFRQNLKNLK